MTKDLKKKGYGQIFKENCIPDLEDNQNSQF